MLGSKFGSEKSTVWNDSKFAGIFNFLGGYIAVLSFLIFGTFVNCMSGNSVKSLIAISNFDLSQSYKIFIVMLSFIFGSFLGAALLNRFIYMIPLLLEGTLLLLTGMFKFHCGVCIAAIAMGIQNAITTCISRKKGRLVVRTTHVTGTCTDIGILIANKDKKSTIFFCIMVCSYLAGSLTGILAFKFLSNKSFILGAIIVFVVLVNRTAREAIPNGEETYKEYLTDGA